MKDAAWVALGGALGALARYLTYKFVGTGAFPYATLLINALGSFVFGLFLTQIRANQGFALFFAVGVLGAYTTFSTFSFETITLLKEGHVGYFAMNILLSVAICLSCFAAGDWLSTRFIRS